MEGHVQEKVKHGQSIPVEWAAARVGATSKVSSREDQCKSYRMLDPYLYFN